MPLSAPLDSTIRRLFAVSSNHCAFLGCQTPIVDPSSNTILAEVCHIKARSSRGPRFDLDQTDEERHGFDNLILMCGVHHKLIDAPENAQRYTVESLLVLKAKHESQGRSDVRPAATLSSEQIAMLLASTSRYEEGSIHNDFRQAVFKVGGDGGGWGGGGGSGGILTIVGTTRLPASINLDGQAGRAPGGGGGGSGLVTYVGRPIDTDDLASGLRLSSIFLANFANYCGPLLNVLGATWTYISLSTVPCKVKLWLALVLELGNVEPTTLLRLSVRILSPSRIQAGEQVIDIAAPENADLVQRASRLIQLEFEVTDLGKWTIEVYSSVHCLGSYEFECRDLKQPQ